MTGGASCGALVSAAAGLADGAEVGGELRAGLSALLAERAGPDGALLPPLGPLVARRRDTPDWWGADNLFLAAPEVTTTLAAGLGMSKPSGNLAILGENTNLARMSFPAKNGLIVVGARVDMPLGSLAAMNDGVIVLGEDCTATSWARVDARNGGIVLVGGDGMWGGGVNLVTDDMHTIRDLETGRRTNGYGGRIIVERHVWLSDGVRLSGGARVGENAVVGYAASVRGAVPPGSVCVGTPARAIRQGVTWTREDAP